MKISSGLMKAYKKDKEKFKRKYEILKYSGARKEEIKSYFIPHYFGPISQGLALGGIGAIIAGAGILCLEGICLPESRYVTQIANAIRGTGIASVLFAGFPLSKLEREYHIASIPENARDLLSKIDKKINLEENYK